MTLDEILVCDHSDESDWAVFPCGAVNQAAQSDYLTLNSSDETQVCHSIQMKVIEKYFQVVVVIVLLHQLFKLKASE